MPPRERDELLESIAANVRRRRSELGLTQQELAERAGVDLRYLQKVEAAEVDFRVSLLPNLADALEERPERLLEPATLLRSGPGRPPRQT